MYVAISGPLLVQPLAKDRRLSTALIHDVDYTLCWTTPLCNWPDMYIAISGRLLLAGAEVFKVASNCSWIIEQIIYHR